MELLELAHSLGISYKRLHGWEPRTVQRGLDADGNPVALADAWEIVTEVEPEWDDVERGRLLALGRYRAKICACGYHESLASDPANHFTLDVRTCPVCRGQAQFKRIQDASDAAIRKRQGDKKPPGTPDPADGRRVVARLMSPTEVVEATRGGRAGRGPRSA